MLLISALLIVLTALAIAGAALAPQTASGKARVGNKILAHKLAVALGQEAPVGKEMPLSSGVMQTLFEAAGVNDQRIAAWARTHAGKMAMRGPNAHAISKNKTEGCQNVFHGHGQTNTRVNQDCSFRRQAEEMVQLNPLDEHNIIAGQNDSRIGFNHCGYDWSFDGGKNWGDQVPPFWQYVQLDGHTADACSDPTGTFDSRGNAYVGGVFFDITSDANSVLVMKSNAGNGGAFYHSPAPGAFQQYTDTPGVVSTDLDELQRQGADDGGFASVEPEAGQRLHDVDGVQYGQPQPDLLQPVDGRRRDVVAGSRDQRLQRVDLHAPVRGPVQRRPGVRPCRRAGRDDLRRVRERQHPRLGRAAGPDGQVSGRGRLQQLGQLDGADQGRRHALDAPGRAAESERLPEPAVPATERLPRSGRDDRDDLGRPAQQPVHDVGRPPQQHERALPAPTHNGSPPCDHDVFYAFSTDGGTTWSATRDITPRSRFGENAQWQPWSEVTNDGSRLWVAYYDRSYGNCEFTGCNDITAAEIMNPASGNPNYRYERVTTDSMPNLTPANNPVQAGFLGDYMWVDTDSHNDAHVVWADTRPIRGTVPEEDVYYAEVKHH